MARYRVQATLESPVAIRRDRQSERSESARSVAGTLVRGALAQLYLQRHGQVDELFDKLFMNDSVCRFGPLDPGPCIFPVTAAACKREGATHALVDQLWFRVAQQWLGGHLPDGADTAWRHCGVERCGADLKPHVGFWAAENGITNESAGERHSIAAHVGIDRATSTAAESIFYTLEALDPSGQTFDLVGWLEAEGELIAALRELLEENERVVYLGHHRTRGYGRVRLEFAELPAVDESPTRAGWENWSGGLVAFLTGPLCRVPDLDSQWIELRIPHRFRYPVAGSPHRVQAVVELWHDEAGDAHFTRLCDLQASQENH